MGPGVFQDPETNPGSGFGKPSYRDRRVFCRFTLKPPKTTDPFRDPPGRRKGSLVFAGSARGPCVQDRDVRLRLAGVLGGGRDARGGEWPLEL